MIVPDDILLKQGRLTPDELQVIAHHDRLGVELIASSFDCKELTQIVEFRGARFDGAGRPKHLLFGKEIPLGARILSICDSYDSMITDHVYREGSSHEVAIEELRRFAGTQFDPELVEHFAETISQKPDWAKSTNASEIAIQIGFQVERLATAIENQDAPGICSLAKRFEDYAKGCDALEIADAADRIRHQADTEDVSWLELLRSVTDLLDLCSQTQSQMQNGIPLATIAEDAASGE